MDGINMKQPSLDAYAEAAHLLMEASPRCQTTTLEVKNLLRFMKFHATQADVSEVMADLQVNFGWQIEHVEEGGNSFKVFSTQPLVEEDPNTFDFR